MLRIGVDASNIVTGGGLTHLVELLKYANLDPKEVKVILWGGQHISQRISPKSWLEFRHVSKLDKGRASRFIWRFLHLNNETQAACDILFVPGSLHCNSTVPFVTLSQNLLPFDWQAQSRFGFSFMRLRYWILFLLQKITFERALAIIYLSSYAQKTISPYLKTRSQSQIIPHGVAPQFSMKSTSKNSQKPCSFIKNRTIKLLYVSIINMYKHQWQIVHAVSELSKLGYRIELHLIGSAYGPALKKLERKIKAMQAENQVFYHGLVEHDDLHHFYQSADIFIFASSCENLPIILLEAMSAGLPIACTHKPPMTDILQDAGVYFDPDNVKTIVKALQSLLDDPQLQARLGEKAYQMAQCYTWERCSQQTFDFIKSVYQETQ